MWDRSERSAPTDPTPEPTDTPAPIGDARAALQAALQDAQAAILAGQQALADGDFAAYGVAQDQLAAALERALAAEEALGG